MIDQFHGLCYGLATANNVVVQGHVRNAKMSRSFGHGHRQAIELDHLVLADVVHLLALRGPATVARFVVAVAVDAVKRVALWSFAHVVQERTEVVQPLVAHADAAPAVERVGALSWVTTSFLGVSPRDVRRGESADASGTVLHVAGRSIRSLVAAATPSVAATQVFAVLAGDGAALAPHTPEGAALRDGRIAFDDGEFAESLAGKVFRCKQDHGNDYSVSVLNAEAKA